MKKILFIAMIFLASSVCANAQSKKKKNKKDDKQKVEQVQPVALQTSSDSLSYAAGYAATEGLMPYLQQQLHVDTAYLADFVRGYQEALAKTKDPAYVAYMAGSQIASQAQTRIFPNMTQALSGSRDSLREELFHKGFMAGVQSDTTLFNVSKAGELFQKCASDVKAQRDAAYKAENDAWLRNNATQQGVVTMPSGLQYKVIKAGTGAKPTADQTVEVIYEGKTIDGKVFDATSRHGDKKTDSFRCNQVIKGWTEALTLMPVGSKWELYIPQDLAYGERQAGEIKPYSTLIFTVELVGIEAPAAAPAKAAKAKK